MVPWLPARHESVNRLLELRATLYADYLLAMEETGRWLLQVWSTAEASERLRAAHAAFDGCGLGGARQKIHVLAPASTVEAADAVFHGLRGARDFVATADQHDSDSLHVFREEVGALRDVFQEAARNDVRALLAGSARWTV
ncbi:hypothetical protein [Streptomyces sp. NPDC008125]|uniref:hypothetical protein n=1 Tax=Streptomyces sp. NPDC008125 TaxID=3364811 RepID=UPI0036E74A7B